MRRQTWKPLPKSYLTKIGLLYGDISKPEPIGSTTKPKPRKRAVRAFKAPSEDHEQQVFMKWAHSHPIVHDLIFHIPNQRRCSLRTGQKLKMMGVRAGVSDLFLPYPSGRFHGLWIEMKAQGGRLQDNQTEWLDRMSKLNYKAVVCYGAQDAIKAVCAYLGEC